MYCDTGGPDVGGPDVGGPDVGGPDVGGPDVGGPDVRFPTNYSTTAEKTSKTVHAWIYKINFARKIG